MFKHEKSYMEQEIFEQSKITKTILDNYIKDNNIEIDIPQNISRIVIIASGSSYHCARYAAELFGAISKIEARAIYSSEFLLEETIPNEENILYIFITQSGETTDTNSALKKAKEMGAKTLCITNKEKSSIWLSSDYRIMCHAGEEKSIAATKSLTSQLLCVTLLALKLAKNKNIEIFDYLQDIKTVPSFIDKTYALHPKIKLFAKFLSKFNHIIVTADGNSYALAKETALKIKETSYKITTATILGEFMHGHVAVLNNAKTALLYILNDEVKYTTIKNLKKIKENYNPPICIIGNTTNQIKSTYNINIDCPSPIVKTFCIIVIIQILALEIALKLHKNVDKPHGLNKVVK